MRGRSILMSSTSFVQDVLEDGDIEVKKIHTKDNPTDMLAKVVIEVKFNHCKNLL